MIGAETLRIALGGLVANKLRSGLTILGLTIGVASVIVLVAVGNGSSHAVQARIEALGSNVLLVLRGATRGGAATTGVAPRPLTLDDASALADRAQAPDVTSASPVVNAPGTTLVSARGVSYAPQQLVGTTASYAAARDDRVAAGSFFTRADVRARRRAIVLGPTAAQNLGASVGDTIQAGGASFQVIGITAPKGSNGFQDQDDVAFAPVSAVQDTLTGYGDVDQIVVQARSRGALDAAQAEVTSILDARHKVSAADQDFQVINQGSILAASSSTSDVFTTLLGEVAAISLLVGGIGVMNIMLVSVTERTREIGIRKAIGARRSDVLAQFLVEAVLVAVLGGIAGVALGVLGSQLTIAGVHPLVAPYSIALAFGSAVLTGLFFGTYPASRAARLRPIEALRYE